MFRAGLAEKNSRRANLIYGVCYKHVEQTIEYLCNTTTLSSDLWPVISNIDNSHMYYSYFDAEKKKLSIIEGWEGYIKLRKKSVARLGMVERLLNLPFKTLNVFLTNNKIDTAGGNPNFPFSIEQYQLILNEFGKEFFSCEFIPISVRKSKSNINLERDLPNIPDPEESFFIAFTHDNRDSWGY